MRYYKVVSQYNLSTYVYYIRKTNPFPTHNYAGKPLLTAYIKTSQDT